MTNKNKPTSVHINFDGHVAEHKHVVAVLDISLHVTQNDTCQHEFEGWREFEDGNGGEAVCKHCGLGAMAFTLRTGP